MDADKPQPVVVVDFNMKFGSMIVFMIKFAIAAIPAAIILGIVFAMVAGIFSGFGTRPH